MSATPDEIRDQLSDQLMSGNAEEQIGDRRVRKYSPKEILEAARDLASDSSATGPFVRIGFKGRAF